MELKFQREAESMVLREFYVSPLAAAFFYFATSNVAVRQDILLIILLIFQPISFFGVRRPCVS